MGSDAKWQSLELLANDRSWWSLTILEMKRIHDQNNASYGVWSNTQDSVNTLNSLKNYKDFVERTEGRVINLVVNGTDVPYDLPPKKTKA
ncbi:hypothetical protein [Desulfovibrio sp. JC022]|uniref:hypothetical protein n=1 Tax=Desulfovibrio sp. JC022 TaxID=2593642 RepID=UPI0013D2B262|nr:hypothetical protein [Desulfovibrio sp. JC022]NDV23684.1 hypothetical protein [Desulfovibrio sp. JC022]